MSVFERDRSKDTHFGLEHTLENTEGKQWS